MHSDLAPTFHPTVACVLLDALRGGAALLVCVGHWRYFFFVDYPQLPHTAAGTTSFFLLACSSFVVRTPSRSAS